MVKLYELLVALVAAGLLAVFVTQVVLPLLRGTTLFPWFSKRKVLDERDIREQRDATQEAEYVAEQLKELHKAQQRVDRKMK